MKVYQIISEAKAGLVIGKGEYLGYSYDPNSKTLTYPDGKTVKANNATDAQKLSSAHKQNLGSSKPSKKTVTNPDVKTGKIAKLSKKTADYDIKNSGKGKIQVTYKPEGGKTKVFKGNAREVLKQMGNSGDKGALRGLARIGANSAKYNTRVTTILKRSSYLGLGYVAFDTYMTWINEYAALKAVFENVYQGSELDSNHPILNELMLYNTKTAAATIGVAVSSEAVQLIATGKIVKMLKYARALQVGLAATGWGIVIAALVWALSEGSMWLAKWWFKKYGPDYFQSVAIDSLSEIQGDIVPKEKAPKVSNSEIAKEIKKAANDNDDAIQDPTLAFKNWKQATESFVN